MTFFKREKTQKLSNLNEEITKITYFLTKTTKNYLFKGGWPARLPPAPIWSIILLIDAGLEGQPRHAAKLVRGLIVGQGRQVFHDPAQRHTCALAAHLCQLFRRQLRLLELLGKS